MSFVKLNINVGAREAQVIGINVHFWLAGKVG